MGNMFTSFDLQQPVFWAAGAFILVMLFLTIRKVAELSASVGTDENHVGTEDKPGDAFYWMRHPLGYGPSRAVVFRASLLLIFIVVFFFSMSPTGYLPDMENDNAGVTKEMKNAKPELTPAERAKDAEDKTPHELKWVRDEKDRESLKYNPKSSMQEDQSDIEAILKRAQKRNSKK